MAYPPRSDRERGFSLIEVIIGMFVVAVALIGLLVMVSSSMKQTTRSYNVATASQVAAAAIEKYKGTLSVPAAFDDMKTRITDNGGTETVTDSMTVKNTTYFVNLDFTLDATAGFIRGEAQVRFDYRYTGDSVVTKIGYKFPDPSTL